MEQLDYVGVMFSLIMQLSCFGVFVVPIGEVHRSMLGPPIDEPSILLDSWRGILARGGLSLLSISRWPPSTVVSEARVLLSRGQCNHANEGQRWKATDGGGAVGIAIFPIPKHTSKSWQNSKLPLREVFCAPIPSPPGVPERYLEATCNSP